MRKSICIIFCLIALFACIGCNSNSDTVSLTSGNYYAEGDYEELMTPYLWLDTKENRFSFGAGSIISYAENGTYEIVDSKIVATSQSTTFEFEIKDKDTLVLINNGNNEYFKIPINTEFVFSKDLK